MALTTAVLVVSASVKEAIDRAALSSVADADRVVQAKSSSGMRAELVRRMKVAAPDATLAPSLMVNSRLAEGDRDPLLVVGVTPTVAGFLPAEQRVAMKRLADGKERGLVLTREWAEDRGVAVGDELAIESPRGVSHWHVAALADGPSANGGAVAAGSLPSVARAFDRTGVVDVVLASSPGDPNDLAAALERAVAGAAEVTPPEASMDSYSRAFQSVQNLLNIFVAVVILAAGGILFFSWRVALEDSREQLARLRLSGARVSHLAGASAAILALALALSVAIGGPLGLLLGASLSDFTSEMVALSQLSASPTLPVAGPLMQGFSVTLLVFGVALVASLLAIRRMQVIEAVVGQREVATAPSLRVPLIAAAAAITTSVAIFAIADQQDQRLALLPLLAGLLSLSLIAPVALGALLRWRPGFGELSAGRELAFSARRTAALLSVFGLAIAMAVALSGVADSLKSGIDRGVRAWTVSDLFLQTAESGNNLQDDKFNPQTLQRVAAVDGVASVGWFTYSTLALEDTRIPIWTWGPRRDVTRYAQLEVDDGASGAALWRALDGDTAAVSSNYARLHDVAVGETLTVPGIDGERDLRVVAVVDDLTSPAGVLIVGPRTYDTLIGDTRPYQIIADLRPGADVADVRAAVGDSLRGAYPEIVVYDQDGIRDRFAAMTGSLVQTFVVFGRVMFLLALLIGAATLATSLTVRQRSLALTRLVGASTRTVQLQLLLEAVALGVAAWLIAAPVGIGLTYSLMSAVASQSGLLPPVEPPWLLLGLSLPIAAVMSVASLMLAGPRRRLPITTAALTEE